MDDALLQRLKEKYEYKTSLIDEIGQLHDKCNDKIKATDEKSIESLKKIDKILAKLEGVSPLNNPTPKNATPKMQAFIDKVQKLLDRGQKLRDKVQRIQDELNDQDQKLKDIVQPVQELKEREVGTKEIKQCRDALLHMLEELQADFDELCQLDDEMDKLDQETEDLINKDKLSRLEDADKARKELDALLDDL